MIVVFGEGCAIYSTCTCTGIGSVLSIQAEATRSSESRLHSLSIQGARQHRSPFILIVVEGLKPQNVTSGSHFKKC